MANSAEFPTYSKEQFSSSHYQDGQFPALCGDLLVRKLKPLSIWLQAWKAIPCVSRGVVKKQNNVTPVCSQATSLWRCSSNFGTGQQCSCSPESPKRDSGLSPILDLRHLNCSLMKMSFKILTMKQISTGDCFLSMDLKDACFHIQIAPHHRPFLRFMWLISIQSYHSDCLWLRAL